MKTILEGLILAAVCVYVLYSCTLGVPMAVETYNKVVSHEIYHPKVNASEKE